MNYYERYSGDYLRDTRHLSLTQHGAYTLLLDTYYATEKPLPADAETLYRICCAVTPAERKAVDSVVREFFWLDGEAYRNRRADAEIAEAQPRIQSARANGSRGGRPRKEPNRNPVGYESETQRDTQPETQQKPDGLPTGKPHQAPSTKHQPTLTVGGLPTAAVPAGESARASPAEISIAMRQSGVQSQPADPRIIALAEQGVSVATVAAACEAAKASKPDESIGAGYIVKIIERWAREAANLQTNGARPPQSSGGIHAERKRTLDALTGRSDDSRAGEIIDVAARQVG